MKRRNSKQPTDKKPLLANSKLWREIPIDFQGKVRGGQGESVPDGVSGEGVSF